MKSMNLENENIEGTVDKVSDTNVNNGSSKDEVLDDIVNYYTNLNSVNKNIDVTNNEETISTDIEESETLEIKEIVDDSEIVTDTSEFDTLKVSRRDLRDNNSSIRKDNKTKINLEYYNTLRDNPSNKKSVWLNIIAFIIPILGVFWCFYYLLKCPKRSKSMLKVVGVSMIFQVSFIVFCYLFLFDFLGNLCLTLFG